MSNPGRKAGALAAGLIPLLMAGCFGGSTTKGGDSLADAESALSRAEQARVGDYDAADLRLARENLSAARDAELDNEREKNRKSADLARWLAARARLHAELGISRSEAARLKAQVQAMQREIDERQPPSSAAEPAATGT